MEDKLSPLPQKGFSRSKGRFWCLLLCTPVILGGPSDVLCTCWCWSFDWFFTQSSAVLFRTPSQVWGRLYLPIFLLMVGLFTIIRTELLYCFDSALHLHVHYGEVVPGGGVASGGPVAMYGWRCFEVFFIPFTKCSSWLSYALMITFQLLESASINGSTFLIKGVFILGWHKDVLYCSVSFEVGLDATFITNVLEAFPQAPHVWHDYVPFGFVADVYAAVVVVITTAAFAGVDLLEILKFHPIQCQWGYLHLVGIFLKCSLNNSFLWQRWNLVFQVSCLLLE